MSAGSALQAAAMAALGAVEGLGVYEGTPVQAAYPHAVAEIGPESDWGHKSGEGREVRLAIVLRDKGEQAVRLRALVAEAEAAIMAIAPVMEGWQLVSLALVRGRMMRDKEGWIASSDYRARMLRV